MKIKCTILSVAMMMALVGCSSAPAATSPTISATTPVTVAATIPSTTGVATLPVTTPVTTPATTPSTTSPIDLKDTDLELVLGYLELNLGDWFSIKEDSEHEVFRLEPKELTKATFIMLDESSGPMLEQWAEMKDKILRVSEEICTEVPKYRLVVTNWGEKSDYLLFSVKNGQVIEDYLTPEDNE